MTALFELDPLGRLLPGAAGLSEEQAEALDLDRHVVVTAGAGSGKTRTLARRYVRILGAFAWEEASTGRRAPGPDAVVVTTFTRRAAAEMRGRIRAELGRAVRELRDRREELAALPGLSGAVVDALRAHLLRCREGFERARIDTFHGFCGQTLREFAPAAGLNPDFALLDGSEQLVAVRDAAEAALVEAERLGEPAALFAHLRRREVLELLHEWVRRRTDLRAFRDVLHREDDDGLLDLWLRRYGRGDLVEMEAAVRPGGALYRALWAVDEAGADWQGGDPPPMVDAAGRALARCLEAVPLDLLERADRLRAIAEPFLVGGRDAGFRSPKGSAAWCGLQQFWAPQAYRPMKEAWAHAASVLPAVFGDAAELLDRLPGRVDRLAVSVLRALDRVGAAALARYAALKEERDALDFDDLQSRLLDLLEGDEAVRRAVQQRCRHVLVDEFQDTNALQWRLVRLLRGEPLPGAGLFLVGDPKQAIYRFRGGDVSLFERATAELLEVGGREVRFTRNFRSRPGLIGVFNHLFRFLLAAADDPTRPPWEAPFAPLSPGRTVQREAEGEVEALPGDDGRVQVIRVEEDGGEAAEREQGESAADLEDDPIELVGVAREAAVVAERVRDLLPYLPVHEGLQVALLFRRRRNLPQFAQALRRLGVPHTVASGRGFFGRQEVRDLASLLLSLAHRDDLVSLLAALRGPFFGLEDAWLVWLARLGRAAGEHALRRGWDDLLTAADAAERGEDPGAPERLGLRELPAEGERALLHAAGRWNRWDGFRRLLPLSGFLRRLLDESAAVHLFAMEDPSGQVVANVEKLLALAASYDTHGSEGAADFGRRLRALEEAEAVEGDAAVDASAPVVLMTIHQSKGLEFPCVVLPDLHASIRPQGPGPQVGRLASVRPDGPGDERWELGLRLPVVDGEVRRLRPTLLAAALREREIQEERAESKRLLYVAMTRARDRVICVHRPPSKAALTARNRDDCSSWEEWLRAWERCQRGLEQLAWHRSETLPPPVFGSALRARVPGSDLPPADLVELIEVSRRIGPVAADRLVRLAPSSLLPRPEVAEEPASPPAPAEVRAPVPGGVDGRILGRLRGILVHECLEDGLVAPSAVTDHRVRRLLADEGLAGDLAAREQLRGDLRRHLAHWTLAAPEPLKRFDPDAPVFRELPFRLALPGPRGERRRLEGQIDALYFDRDADVWVVVDYKTDSGPPEEVVARYRPQLLAYVWAASRVLADLRERGGRVRADLLLTHHGLSVVALAPMHAAEADSAFQAVLRGASGNP